MRQSSFLGIRLLHWLAALLLLLTTGFFLLREHRLISPEPVLVDYDPVCDLRAGSCESLLNNGARVSLGILPLIIPLASKLDINVEVSGLDVKEVMLDLNGVSMKMPPNRVKLEPVKSGHFEGQTSLAYCARSAMEWEARVELKTSQGLFHVPYRFITVSDANFDALTQSNH